MSIRLRILDRQGRPDARALNLLKSDLQSEVGEAEYATAGLQAGGKGEPISLAIVLGLLNAKAVAALVGVLRSHLARDESGEIEVSGPGGSVRLKLAKGQSLSDLDVAGYIERALAAPDKA